MTKGFGIWLLAVYGVFGLLFTQTPFDHSLGCFEQRLSSPTGLGFDTLPEALGTVEFWGNLLMTVPLGLAVAWILGRRRKWLSIAVALIAGLLFSALIETLQLASPARSASAVDLLTNATGAVIGAWAAPRGEPTGSRIGDWASSSSGWVLTLALACYIGVVWGGLNARRGETSFDAWDPGFRLVLGNEASGERPWLGEVHLVAIYARSLPPEEAKGLYELNPNRLVGRSKPALLLNLLGTSTVAARGVEVTLQAEDPEAIRQLSSQGIEILRPTRIVSESAPDRLIATLRRTDELSVEVWIKPADLHQNGPARIVSLSGNPGATNFTLAQYGRELEFRLRTGMTDLNGAPKHLRTASQPLTGGLQHIVVTYRDGIEHLYVDGYPVTDVLYSTPTLAAFRSAGRIGQFGFAWVLAFPLGAAGAWARHGARHSGSPPVVFIVVAAGVCVAVFGAVGAWVPLGMKTAPIVGDVLLVLAFSGIVYLGTHILLARLTRDAAV